MQIIVYTKTPKDVPSSTTCDWQISLNTEFTEKTITLSNRPSINTNNFTVLIYPIIPVLSPNTTSITYYIRYKYNIDNDLYNNWSQPIASTYELNPNPICYNNLQGFQFHKVKKDYIVPDSSSTNLSIDEVTTLSLAKSIRQSIPNGYWNVNLPNSLFTTKNDTYFYSSINLLYPSNKVWENFSHNTTTEGSVIGYPDVIWQCLYDNKVKISIQSRGCMGLVNEANIIEIDLTEGIPFKIKRVGANTIKNTLYYVPSLPCDLVFESDENVTINNVALGVINSDDELINFNQSTTDTNLWSFPNNQVPANTNPYYLKVEFTNNGVTDTEYFCFIMSSLITSPSLLGINC